jgi:hypothetical protein
MDPDLDPGGPKTCGSGSRSGSPTLVFPVILGGAPHANCLRPRGVDGAASLAEPAVPVRQPAGAEGGGSPPASRHRPRRPLKALSTHLGQVCLDVFSLCLFTNKFFIFFVMLSE